MNTNVLSFFFPHISMVVDMLEEINEILLNSFENFHYI